MATPAPLISKDVIIIGAGWHGLQAAKTYLAIKPSDDLTIIDSDSGVGGGRSLSETNDYWKI
jgi:dimethylaniline monooxygenase (N-oxide forming)